MIFRGTSIDCDQGLIAWVVEGAVRTSSPLFALQEVSANPLWIRCARAGDHVGVVVVDGTRDVALWSQDGVFWQELGPAHGQRPVEVAGTGAGFRIWVVTGPDTYQSWVAHTESGQAVLTGVGTMPKTSQGILDSQDGQLLWTDAHEWRQGLRYAVEGGGGYLVGQEDTRAGRTDALMGLFRGDRHLIYPGLVREPRVAHDGEGLYTVVGVLAHGQLVQLRGEAPLTAHAPPAPPAPPPPPVPPPPPPNPGEVSMDAIAPREITWLHADIGDWKVTSRITDIRFTDDTLELRHTQAGQWPTSETIRASNGGPLEGNPWVFAVIDGRWYGATYEWLRPGQTKKGIHAGNIGPHVKRDPLTHWRPQVGELVGFAVSTPARDSRRTVQERSAIVLAYWGKDGIATPSGPIDDPPVVDDPPPVRPPTTPGPDVPFDPTPWDAVLEELRRIRTASETTADLLQRAARRFGL